MQNNQRPKPKIIKLLEENIGKQNFRTLDLSRMSWIGTPKAQATKVKIN